MENHEVKLMRMVGFSQVIIREMVFATTANANDRTDLCAQTCCETQGLGINLGLSRRAGPSRCE